MQFGFTLFLLSLPSAKQMSPLLPEETETKDETVAPTLQVDSMLSPKNAELVFL